MVVFLRRLIKMPLIWKEISKDILQFFTIRTIKGDKIQPLGLFPHIDTYLISSAEDIEYVLVKNNRNYTKGMVYKFLQIVLGKGLLTSEGDFWRRQRRIAQPAFHRQVVASFTDEIEQLAESVISRWKVSLNSGADVLNIADEMMKLTVSITANLLFGTDISGKESRVLYLVGDLNEKLSNFLKTPMPLPLWVPTKHNRDFRERIDELNIIITDIIEKRRNSATKRPDLLQMLMDVEDEETGERMNDVQLKDEVMTLFLAGSETSSNALAWTLHLLCNNSLELRKVLEEIDRLKSEGAKGLVALKNLNYLNQVIQESLRLYPPAWILSREAINEDVVGGQKISKGAQIYISIHGMHRHPKYWNDPEKFSPSRFKEANHAKYSFFPFGGGPRLCIGAELAKMEILLSLYKLLQEFNFEPTSKTINPEALITLRPKNGLFLKISSRDKLSISYS
ncbi:MAG: cytochrome P450 [Bacteroidota bacterium]|nr:cytochrome P450 [Bacteroidota bacterium]